MADWCGTVNGCIYFVYLILTLLMVNVGYEPIRAVNLVPPVCPLKKYKKDMSHSNFIQALAVIIDLYSFIKFLIR